MNFKKTFDNGVDAALSFKEADRTPIN